MSLEDRVVNQLHTWCTPYCPDTMEWCPIEPFLRYFLCGTYELLSDDNRIGQLHLYKLEEGERGCILLQSLDVKAILDVKWYKVRKISGNAVFAAADSAGNVSIGSLNDVSYLQILSENEIASEGLTLSVDWCHSTDAKLCASDSKGGVSIWRLEENYGLQIICKLTAHQHEAWTASFNYFNHNLIFTGGDDNIFKMYDLRYPVESLMVQREHVAGVTSIKMNYLQEHVVATGSYDETVKTWDVRNMKISVHSHKCSGGVWRIKWSPQNPKLVFLACMYGGFDLVSIDNAISPLCHLEAGSIAYGVDFCQKTPSLAIASSFYDKMCSLLEITEKQ